MIIASTKKQLYSRTQWLYKVRLYTCLEQRRQAHSLSVLRLGWMISPPSENNAGNAVASDRQPSCRLQTIVTTAKLCRPYDQGLRIVHPATSQHVSGWVRRKLHPTISLDLCSEPLQFGRALRLHRS
jgi:hypothetical protein